MKYFSNLIKKAASIEAAFFVKNKYYYFKSITTYLTVAFPLVVDVKLALI